MKKYLIHIIPLHSTLFLILGIYLSSKVWDFDKKGASLGIHFPCLRVLVDVLLTYDFVFWKWLKIYKESNVTNGQTWNSGYLHEPTTFYMALFYVFANVIIIFFYCATTNASLEPIKCWPFVDWFRKNVTISHIK